MGVQSLLAAVLMAAAGQVSPGRQVDGDRAVYVVGQVADQQSGLPLGGAEAWLVQAPVEDGTVVWRGTTEEDGSFQAGRLSLGRYQLRVEALGFTSVEHVLSFEDDGTVELGIELSPEALELEPIVVAVTRRSRLEDEGFFARRRAGLGSTLTRVEIEALGSRRRVSDLLFGLPGVQVIPPRTVGGAGIIRLRQGCRPVTVINGRPLGAAVALDDVLGITDVEAMEVYHGANSPPQYGGNGCGSVLVWTREYGVIDGSPFSWLKTLGSIAAMGFVLWLTS